MRSAHRLRIAGPVRRLAPAVIVVSMVSGRALLPLPAVAQQPDESTTEAEFVARINDYRQANGLRALQVDNQLVSVAHGWASRMAAAHHLDHNPNLGSEVTAPWTTLGENVGAGCSVDDLMQAFIASPRHHDILTNPVWSFVGVGTAHTPDGCLYTTHDFMAIASAPPSVQPPHPAQPPPPPSSPTPPVEPDRVQAVLVALRLIETEAPDPGLTTRVARLLQTTRPQPTTRR